MIVSLSDALNEGSPWRKKTLESISKKRAYIYRILIKYKFPTVESDP